MDYYMDFDYALSGLMGGFAVIAIIIGILTMALVVVSIVATWKLFKKAGKKGWESIVPFYSYWVLVEIAGLNWWWFLLIICNSVVSMLDLDELSAIASLVSFFASFNCYYNIAKKFDKNTGYAVCTGLFTVIFVMILGFSKKEVYDIKIPVSKNGVFNQAGESANNSGNYQSNVYESTGYKNTTNMTDNDSLRELNQTANYETTQQSQEFSFCGNCGTKLNKDTKFCPNCGKEKS